MLLYRLAKTAYAKDMSGEGARIKGGRWSPPGVPVIHTSESAALAAMELLVHIGNPRFLPKGALSLIVYELADNASLLDLPDTDLPANWNTIPAPPELKTIGENWLAAERYLALRLPSAPMPFGTERNMLVNPRHPDFSAQFRIVDINPYDYDQRLAKG